MVERRRAVGGGMRWWWLLGAAVVAALVPFALTWTGWIQSLALPVYVLLAVAVAAWVRRGLQARDLGPGERRAELRALVPAVCGGALYVLAVLVVTSGVLLLVHTPGTSVATSAWRLPADGGTGVPLVVLTAAAAWALRRISPRVAAAWWAARGLPPAPADRVEDAAREVARARRWRTLPAVLGAATVVAPGAAYNRAIAEGVTGERLDALLAVGPARTLAVGGPLLGYLLGVVVAEATRRRPRGEVGVARLDARQPVRYLSPLARRLPVAVAGLLLALVAVRAAYGPPPAGPYPYPMGPSVVLVLAVVALLVIGVAAVQRWVVGRAQRFEDPIELQLDDTFRSSAAHAVVGGASALGLAVAAGLLDDIWNAVASDLGLLGLPLGIVGLTVSAATFGVWFGLGSSHPGRRPATAAVAPTSGGTP